MRRTPFEPCGVSELAPQPDARLATVPDAPSQPRPDVPLPEPVASGLDVTNEGIPMLLDAVGDALRDLPGEEERRPGCAS